MPYTPSLAGYQALSVGFRAHRTTAQALSAATFTKVIFATEIHDSGNDYDTTTGDWTVPTTGWYNVGAWLSFSSVADGSRMIVAVYVNGSASVRLTDTLIGAAGNPYVGGSVPLLLTAGDAVSIYAWRTAAGDVGGDAYNIFTGASF